MAVKENQKGLCEATEELFRRSFTREKNKLPQSEHTEKKENVHVRDESRCCRVIYLEKEVGFFPKEDWPEAHTLIRIFSERKIRSTGVTSTETRYYISSTKKSAKEFNEKVRDHWYIESKLHWSLDVSMNENGDKKWAKEPTKKSIRRKQKMAAMDNSYLLKILFADPLPKSYA